MIKGVRVRGIVLGLLFVISALSLFAQEKESKHEFSINGGYGFTVGNINGLTFDGQDYKKSFNKAPNWGAQYHYLFSKKASLGVVYSGYTVENSHLEGSDCIWQNYLALQFSVYYPCTDWWQLRIGVGGGPVFYQNNSYVFNKSRKVTGNSIGVHGSLSSLFRLSSHWYVVGEIQYLEGHLSSYRSHYHDEVVKVIGRNKENKIALSRISLMAGIAYRF